ncbi:MAG: hypothetical protein FJ303_08670 [Planctomycetes bacterium]|nr:hypothetical protein [Planctomycetota bacterium]
MARAPCKRGCHGERELGKAEVAAGLEADLQQALLAPSQQVAIIDKLRARATNAEGGPAHDGN